MGSSVFFKYPPDSSFDGKRVLNVGCGFSKFMKPNVVNLDAFDTCAPDVKWDLNKAPLPFKDGEFDFIIANHIIEHLENWWGCFNELARILKPGGFLEIWVPGSGSDSQLGFRDHVNVINYCSFYGTYGTSRGTGNAWAKAQDKKREPSSKLKLMDSRVHLHRYWWLLCLPGPMKEWAAKHLRNVIFEDGFIFKKLSDSEAAQ